MSVNRRVAVLSEPVERGQAIAQHLTDSKTEGVACQSSDELSRIVNGGQIDAIVIDHRLVGFLSGLDIVQKLSRDLVRPLTVLVGSLDASERELAARLKVNAVLGMESTPDAIASAALGALYQETHGALMIPHAARMLVRDSDCLAPMPQLLVRLLDFLGNADATIGDLANELLTDAALTAELLKVVNSSAASLSGKVTKIEDAVKLIGIKRTVSLVLAKHLLSSQTRGSKTVPAAIEQQLRQRHVLMASTAATYAKLTSGQATDTAYILGLLQDLGVQILMHHFGAKYAQLRERTQTIAQLQLAVCESREFGFTHADVSAAMLQKWELPPRLIRLVQQHHQPFDTVEGTALEIDLIKSMQIGEAFADCRDQSTAHRRLHLHKLATRCGQLDDAMFRVCLAQSVEKTLEMSRVFDLPPPDGDSLKEVIHKLADGVDFEMPPEPEALEPAVCAAAARPSSAVAPNSQIAAPAKSPITAIRQVTPVLSAPYATALHPPADLGSSSDQARAAEADEWPAGPYLIVLDDEPAVARLVKRMLLGQRIDVHHCTDYASLHKIAGGALAILCDVHLNGQSGIQFMRRLRDSGCEVPVIIISGDRKRETVLESISIGISGYLTKPFNQQTLLDKLEPLRQCARQPLQAN